MKIAIAVDSTVRRVRRVKKAIRALAVSNSIKIMTARPVEEKQAVKEWLRDKLCILAEVSCIARENFIEWLKANRVDVVIDDNAERCAAAASINITAIMIINKSNKKINPVAGAERVSTYKKAVKIIKKLYKQPIE